MRPSRLLACGAALAVVACHSSTAPAPDAVEISVTVSPSAALLGDTIHVSIDVLNATGTPVLVLDQGCNTGFTLLAADGSLAGTVYHPAEDVACPFDFTVPISLAPGESRRIDLFTTGIGYAIASGDPPALVPAGTYLVQPSIPVFRGDEETVPVHLTTNSILFRSALDD